MSDESYHYKELYEAAEALKRAAKAAFQSMQYPHGYASPCPLQQKAAMAEVECALGLVKKSRQKP